jgi:hypothetical protein
MTAVSLDHLWHHLAAWADRQGQPPSHLLILGTGLLAAAVVASRRAWPAARTVVTIAHEGGHALAAVATGRRLHGVRVLHSSAGVTMTAGNPSGPGIILTAMAGYLAAPLLGLGGAALLATGHLLAVLLLSLAGRGCCCSAGYAPWSNCSATGAVAVGPRTTPISLPGSPGCPVDSGPGCSSLSPWARWRSAAGCSWAEAGPCLAGRSWAKRSAGAARTRSGGRAATLRATATATPPDPRLYSPDPVTVGTGMRMLSP